MAKDAASVAIHALGLPTSVVEAYGAQNIKFLYTWQAECFQAGLRTDKNLVYVAPTSGGKTLVAELLLWKTLWNVLFQNECPVNGVHSSQSSLPCQPLRKKIALFVLPYISIVHEKLTYFNKHFASLGIRFQGFYHGSNLSIDKATALLCDDETLSAENDDRHREHTAFHVAICTIEKANALVSHLAARGRLLDTLAMVIVDEIHMVAEFGRGDLINVLLAKVLFFNSLVTETASKVFIVAMSATLRHVSDVAKWLNAVSYETSFRPVELLEFVLCDDTLTLFRPVCSDQLNGEHCHKFQRPCWVTVPQPWRKRRPHEDAYFRIAEHAMLQRLNVLVFCRSKREAELSARKLYTTLETVTPKHEVARQELKARLLAATTATFGTNLDDTDEDMSLPSICLAHYVTKGIAFHHSGLSLQERRLIEDGFRSGTLWALCATPTVAAGVNLPAHCVIFTSPYIAQEFIGVDRYRQMAGRAGRAGHVTTGEVFLLCQRNDIRRVKLMIEGDDTGASQPMNSDAVPLAASPAARLLLEVLACTPLSGEQLRALPSFLFHRIQQAETAPSAPSAILTSLLQLGQARYNETTDTCEITSHGHAIASSGLNPLEGYWVLAEIDRLGKCLVLEGGLHLAYLCSPFSSGLRPHWRTLQKLVRRLRGADRRAVALLGIDVSVLGSAVAQNAPPPDIARDPLLFSRYSRLYTTLLCLALIRAYPVQKIQTIFSLTPGDIEAIQHSVVSFGAMTLALCERIDWWQLAVMLEAFLPLLKFGTSREYLALMELEGMTLPIAK